MTAYAAIPNATKLRVDFNLYDPATHVVWGSLNRQKFLRDGHPVVGEIVELTDGDGDFCLGAVTRIDHPLIWVRCLMDSWQDGPAA